MSYSQHLYSGHYLKVKFPDTDGSGWYNFIEGFDDDIYNDLDDNFSSVDDLKKDESDFIIPNFISLFPGCNIYYASDLLDGKEIELPNGDWSDSWDMLFNELNKQKIVYEKKNGVIVYCL